MLLEVLEKPRHTGGDLELVRVDGAELPGLVLEGLGALVDQRHGVRRLDDDVGDKHVELPDATSRRSARDFCAHAAESTTRDTGVCRWIYSVTVSRGVIAEIRVICNLQSSICNRQFSMQFIYTMKGLGKIHPPDSQVLRDIWLSFYPGAKIGVLGMNGAGKSSLLKIMAGEDPHFTGEAFPSPGIKVGFLHQEPKLDAAKTVLGNVEEGVQATRDLLTRYDELNMKLCEDLPPDEMEKVLDEQGKVQDRIDQTNAWELDSQLEQAMDALRLPPADAAVTTLSGGERRRVALCRLLLSAPDLLLLDEPTNHLDAESVAWLEHHLAAYPGTVVAVTHDRYFLDNVAGWILELDRGHGIPWEGNYSSWLDQKQNRLAQEEKTESKRQRTLQRELEWIRMSPRARQAKGKARLNAYEELLNQDTAQKIDTVEIFIPPGPRLGDVVVEARHLRKGYGDVLLMDDINFTLPRGGIVGVIGPNGAGKTTLFRMITGQETPDGGTLRLGETVQVGYVDQSRDALNAGKTVWEEITGGLDEVEMGKRIRARPRLLLVVQLQGRRAAAQGGVALGRRTQPPAPGQAAQDGL